MPHPAPEGNDAVTVAADATNRKVDLVGGEAIAITIDAGSAIVYGSTVDNITNDPSQQFARPIER